MPEHLEQLFAATSVVPAVNQIELHPYFQQQELQALNAKHGLLTQAWSPIGGVTSYTSGQKSVLISSYDFRSARVKFGCWIGDSAHASTHVRREREG